MGCINLDHTYLLCRRESQGYEGPVSKTINGGVFCKECAGLGRIVHALSSNCKLVNMQTFICL